MLPRTEFRLEKKPSCQATVTLTLDRSGQESLFHQHLTLGIEQKLQENKMIRDVKLIIRKPADKLSLSSWERKHCAVLPQDLRDFYLSTNGLKLTWSLEHAGEILRIGDTSVSTIQNLLPVDASNADSNSSSVNNCSGSRTTAPPDKVNDAYLHMTYAELQQNITTAKPDGLTLGPQGKAFRLDANRSNWGTACLVFPKGCGGSEALKPKKMYGGSEAQSSGAIGGPAMSTRNAPEVEVWFLDPSCRWHFLASSFTHYYRMLLIHLGLPQWQYRFTPFGLSSWAEQIFWVVAPHLLQAPKPSTYPSLYTGLWSQDYPPEAATPNTTPNVLNVSMFRKKKKEP